jgi:uncharacterized membrane protein
MARRPDLSRPRAPRRRLSLGIHYDPDRFGAFSEGIARFLGTAKYLVFQTIFVAVWIFLNILGIIGHWDPYPFILLNLFFSTQAAYAAPLILLAQNRQADRDRAQVERDRDINSRTLSDTEYLAREIATIRMGIEQAATQDDLIDLREKLDLLIENKKK